MGKQEGRHIEIFNSYELKYKTVPAKDGGILVDEVFTKQRMEAYAKMFPDFEFLGWYSTSAKNEGTEADKIVHKKF